MPKNKGGHKPGSFTAPGDGPARNISGSRDGPPQGTNRGRQGSSFAARFGRIILKHGVAAIPSALFHFQGKLGLSAQQVWFTSYMLSHKWDEDLPYPSIAQMAKCTGISDRMLRYRCNELHHLGFLEIYPRYSENGGQSSNYYDFAKLFARLEEIISEETPIPNPIREEWTPGQQGYPNTQATPLTPGRTDLVTDHAYTDTSFLARYGRVILGYGIAAVPRALFTHQRALGLTAQQVWFICYVLSFQWDTALPYPSINKMAERTGYSKQQLHTIKGELVTRGYLEIERRTSEGGGNDTNLYDFSLLFDAIRELLEPGGRSTSTENDYGETEGGDIEQSAEQEASTGVMPEAKPSRRHRPSQPKYARSAFRQPQPGQTPQNDPPAIRLTTGPASTFTTSAATQLTSPPATGFTREVETGFTRQDKGIAPGPSHSALPTGRKAGLPESEAPRKEKVDKDDSNHIPRLSNLSSVDRSPYSPYIAQVISDFSNELHDSEHTVSNVTQALRLWTTSSLGEQDFVTLMYQAKTLTRKYQTRPHWDGLTNKMSYYFTVLRDLVSKLNS